MGTLLADARHHAGLTQAELARAAGTSRPTLSAYEHGHKSPTLDTVERLLDAAGFELAVRPRLDWTEIAVGRGHSTWVPSELPRLDPPRALRTVVLPLTVNWSDPGRRFDLSDRPDRARAYEIVLREGQPEDIAAIVDGLLLVELWPTLVLPRSVRAAWSDLIERNQP